MAQFRRATNGKPSNRWVKRSTLATPRPWSFRRAELGAGLPARQAAEHLARGDRWASVSQRAVHNLRLLLDADAVLLWQRDADRGLRMVCEAARSGEPSRRAAELPAQSPLLPIVAPRPVTTIATHIRSLSPFLYNGLQALQIQAFVAIPIAPHHQHWGWLMVVQSPESPPLSPAASEQLCALAVQLAIGLRLEQLDRLIDQSPIDRPSIASINRPSIDQSINQSIDRSTHRLLDRPSVDRLGMDGRSSEEREPVNPAPRATETRFLEILRLNPSPSLIVDFEGTIAFKGVSTIFLLRRESRQFPLSQREFSQTVLNYS